MESEYLLVGKSEYDFNDRSPDRMKVLNSELKRRIEEFKRQVSK